MLAQKLVGLAGMTIALTMTEGGTIAIAVAQPNATVMAQTGQDRKAEADQLLKQGNQQFQTSQIELVGGLTPLCDSWEYLRREEYPVAIKCFQQALESARKTGNQELEMSSLYGLGWIYDDLGSYQQAIESYRKALKISRNLGNQYQEADLLNLLGWTHYNLGQYQITIELNEQSIAISQSINHRSREGYALVDIGLAYRELKKLHAAEKFISKALSVAKEIANAELQAFGLRDLGYIYQDMGEYEKAIDCYQASVRISQSINRFFWQATGLNALGGAFHATGHYQKALDTYQKALEISQKRGYRANESSAFEGIASLMAKQQQPELAIVFYKQSVSVRETIRQDLRKLPRATQEAYTQSVAKTYRALADLLLQQDRILEAQQVLDLLKLQEFSNSLKDTRSAPQPLAFRKAEQQLLEKFNQQQQGALLAAQDLKTLLDRPENQRSPQDRDRIRQLQQLQEAIAANFIQFIASAEVQTLTAQLRRKDSGSLDPEILNQLQNKLSNQLAKLPHTALFYPLILDDRLELILITPDSAPIRRTVAIKRTDLNRAISTFSSALKDPSQDAKPSAQALYNILIQPIADDLKQANITTLLYSPDRRLRYVPLPALHDGKQWLLETLTVNYITTASTTDLTTPRQPKPQVLAGAISDDRQQRYTVNLPQAQRQFLGLPNVSQELNGIAAQLPNTRTLRDRAFTVDAIKSLFRQYNIFHFATHGSFERDRPELSFILFGGSSGDGKNYATLQDIGTWKLDADLVILSACETGLADDQFTAKADDSVAVMGLGYRFEQAGARATIASLWTVNDASTSALMQQFYANLTNGKITKSEALRQAQLSLLNNKVQPKTKGDRAVVQPNTPNQPTRNDRLSPGYSHPYYWAPFILIGNGL